jgi:hypothetical protein
MMRAQAELLRSPAKVKDKKKKLREAVAGFEEVIAGVKAEDPYKPWHLGPAVADEARRRLGITGIQGMWTWRAILTRQVVSYDNPFVEYAIHRWQFFEVLDEKMSRISTFFALGLLSVAALAVPGVGGAILAAVDIGYSVYSGYKGLKDAYALRRMARLDTDLSVYGVSEEQADAAIHDAWVGMILSGVFAGGLGVLGGLRVVAKGRQVYRGLRYPKLVALEQADPALLAQLLAMGKDLRKVEKLLQQTAGDGRLLKDLLGFGTADEIAGLLNVARDPAALHRILGWTHDLKEVRRLLDASGDASKLAKVLDGVDDLKLAKSLLKEFGDVARLEAALGKAADAAQFKRIFKEIGNKRAALEALEELGGARVVGLLDDGQAVALRKFPGVRAVFSGTAALSDDALKALLRLDADVLPHLKGASAVDLADIARLSNADPAGFSALLRSNKDAVLRYLQYNPAADLKALSKGVTDAGKRVRTPVSGLYDSLPTPKPGDVATPAPGWTVDVVVDPSDASWNSTITSPTGKQIMLGREWDPASGQLTMSTAFGSPSIEMVPTNPAMLPAKGGTSAMNTASLIQMRAMGIPYGKGAASTPLKEVKMSTIQNFETMAHLHWLRQRHPTTPIGELVTHTASYQYAESILTQAGYRVTGARVDFTPGNVPMSQLLEHYEREKTSRYLFQQGGVERATKVHDPIFERYGVFDSTQPRSLPSGAPNPARAIEIDTNYNILLTVEPLP